MAAFARRRARLPSRCATLGEGASRDRSFLSQCGYPDHRLGTGERAAMLRSLMPAEIRDLDLHASRFFVDAKIVFEGATLAQSQIGRAKHL